MTEHQKRISYAKKISEANEKKTFLESQLQQMKVIEAMQTIEEATVIKSLEENKNLLFSSNDEDKKQVLQEYIEKVIVHNSDDKNANIEVFVRCFNGGDDLR